ncbi:GNAT family N-acetyltransferase [Abyssalbus ytuae]|uniref:GNAT family N-acetyltransferase n=1 Tax=Abyssalbus ytuae TaxID=2926907 RepID=A0A9E6ZYA4_9FLAO|nr:GNAT family N-acetyltransferase [Abyssalbus ytuae]UOB16116.1 GNAT family N-acetyltransferase [Abyssalbus ytuae]
MAKTAWVKFKWDLKKITNFSIPVLEKEYSFEVAQEHDLKQIIETVVLAYKTDPIWGKCIGEIKPRMTERINSTFYQPQSKYLLVKYDKEIVAVSGVTQLHWTNQNLLTGICVAKKHQRKGLGTYLMFHSLHSLQNSGLEFANVYTESGSVADKKIYPLFGSVKIENVEYLKDTLENPIPILHNFYYEGKVQSLGIDTPNATIGVIKAGAYTFSAKYEEHVKILVGQLNVKIPNKEWQLFNVGEVYIIPAGYSFNVQCEQDVCYLCEYIK